MWQSFSIHPTFVPILLKIRRGQDIFWLIWYGMTHVRIAIPSTSYSNYNQTTYTACPCIVCEFCLLYHSQGSAHTGWQWFKVASTSKTQLVQFLHKWPIHVFWYLIYTNTIKQHTVCTIHSTNSLNYMAWHTAWSVILHLGHHSGIPILREKRALC